MKRYKLLKDTPAFKAGTECYIEEAGIMVPCRGISYTIVHKDQLEKNPNILTDWFKEIKPAEPLIKDEKIRKAVRAWADANNFSVFRVHNQHFNYVKIHGAKDRYDPNGSNIEFMGTIAGAEKRTYEIDELCGDEEE